MSGQDARSAAQGQRDKRLRVWAEAVIDGEKPGWRAAVPERRAAEAPPRREKLLADHGGAVRSSLADTSVSVAGLAA